MTYLIHSPSVAVRSIAALTGTSDAPLGSIAKTEQGAMFALTAMGWLDVTGTTPPDGASVTVQSGDGTVSVQIEIADGVATIPEGYTLTEAA